MPLFTEGELDAAIGTGTRVDLVGSATTSGSPFDLHRRFATTTVQAKAQVKGYTIGTDSTNDFVKLLAIGQWYFSAGGMRHGLEPPAAIQQALDNLQALEKGLPIPGMDPSTRDGLGGVAASVSTGSGATARVQRLARSKTDPYW